MRVQYLIFACLASLRLLRLSLPLSFAFTTINLLRTTPQTRTQRQQSNPLFPFESTGSSQCSLLLLRPGSGDEERPGGRAGRLEQPSPSSRA
ncbi:hypothetical protein C8Q76DRAFT_700712 [Earliella scabrosa]|nr:hypothetical protein C8Q76DRAFT_700712 [Earliella scabrosa]